MRRGDIYLVKKPASAGPKRQRAFVVVSRQVLIDSDYATVICAPVYTKDLSLSTQVGVGPAEGLKHDSAVHCDGLVSLPKGLEQFFLDGDKRGIQAQHSQCIADILDRLNASVAVQDMSFPGSGLHRLKGTLKDHWSVRVSGNWRITFRFEGGIAHIVDYQDYH